MTDSKGVAMSAIDRASRNIRQTHLPATRRQRALPLPVALLVAAALTGSLLAAVPDQARAASSVAGPLAPHLVSSPGLHWKDCPPIDPDETGPGTFDCATVAVPLDYDRPRGRTIGIALKRHLADDPTHRIGSLFINPGGPGGSGVDVVAFAEFLFSPEVLARFDVIGFDPRGIARSAPLACFKNPQDGFDLLDGLPPFPLGWRQERAYAHAIAGFTGQCGRRGGPIMSHMSTGNVARDLDRLRAAVGDAKLTYAGFSYGSMIGTTYANLFPGRVRAVLIDGVLDPVAWTTGHTRWQGRHVPVTSRLGSAASAYSTLQRYFRLCRQAGPAECALADGGDPKRRFDRVAGLLRHEPLEIETGDGPFLLTYARFVAVTLNVLYDPFSWKEYAAVADDIASQAGFRAVSRSFRRLQDALAAEPKPEQSIEGFPGVLCADSTNPSRWQTWSVAGRLADARSPYFGLLWNWNSIPCATWPVRDQDRFTGPWSAWTSHPVLVVGNRWDPATPLAGAKTVAKLLPRARLLTLNGQGHVAAGLSSCIDAAESAYLVAGTLPPRGKVCQPDFDPFDPPPELLSADPEIQQQEARRQVIGSQGALLR